jgi:hypothetical protein
MARPTVSRSRTKRLKHEPDTCAPNVALLLKRRPQESLAELAARQPKISRGMGSIPTRGGITPPPWRRPRGVNINVNSSV